MPSVVDKLDYKNAATRELTPLVDASNVKGGSREVADVTARDAIPASHRTEGMVAYIVAEGRSDRLNADLTTWEEGALGSAEATPAYQVARPFVAQFARSIGSFIGKTISLDDLGASAMAPDSVLDGFTSPSDYTDNTPLFEDIFLDTDNYEKLTDVQLILPTGVYGVGRSSAHDGSVLIRDIQRLTLHSDGATLLGLSGTALTDSVLRLHNISRCMFTGRLNITTMGNIDASLSANYRSGVRISGDTMNWTGAWSSGTTYAIDDAVTDGGNSYVCVRPNVASSGNQPSTGVSQTGAVANNYKLPSDDVEAPYPWQLEATDNIVYWHKLPADAGSTWNGALTCAENTFENFQINMFKTALAYGSHFGDPFQQREIVDSNDLLNWHIRSVMRGFTCQGENMGLNIRGGNLKIEPFSARQTGQTGSWYTMDDRWLVRSEEGCRVRLTDYERLSNGEAGWLFYGQEIESSGTQGEFRPGSLVMGDMTDKDVQRGFVSQNNTRPPYLVAPNAAGTLSIHNREYRRAADSRETDLSTSVGLVDARLSQKLDLSLKDSHIKDVPLDPTDALKYLLRGGRKLAVRGLRITNTIDGSAGLDDYYLRSNDVNSFTSADGDGGAVNTTEDVATKGGWTPSGLTGHIAQKTDSDLPLDASCAIEIYSTSTATATLTSPTGAEAFLVTPNENAILTFKGKRVGGATTGRVRLHALFYDRDGNPINPDGSSGSTALPLLDYFDEDDASVDAGEMDEFGEANTSDLPGHGVDEWQLVIAAPKIPHTASRMAVRWLFQNEVTWRFTEFRVAGGVSGLASSGSGATTLGGLSDVSTTGATTGTEIIFNGASWAPRAAKSYVDARASSGQTGVTGNLGAVHTVIFGAEITDGQSDFDGVSTFTARNSAVHVIDTTILLRGVNSATDIRAVMRITPNGGGTDTTFTLWNGAGAAATDGTDHDLSFDVQKVRKLDAGDTVSIEISALGAGADTVDIVTGTNTTRYTSLTITEV